MAYVHADDKVGYQPISEISTTKKHVLGTEVDVYDSGLGTWGRAVYVEYKASTAVAAGIILAVETIVGGGANPFRVIAAATATSAGLGVPLFANLNAVSSNAALQYGWALVCGVAPVLKTAVKPLFSSALGISATAGRVFITTTSSDQILGVRLVQSSVTTTTSLVNIYFNRAHTGVVL